MNFDARLVFLLPALAVLLATKPSVFVHGIIAHLAYKTTTLGGVVHIYDGLKATSNDIATDINHLQINLRYLYEVGNNTSVILRGTDSLDRTFFDLVDLKPSSTGGISASVATVSTDLLQGNLALNVYLMTGTGTFVNADESVDVDFFDVKLNIVLSNYNFCDDCPPRNDRNVDFLEPLRHQESAADVATDDEESGRGEYIDVAFSVIGRTLREAGKIGRVSSDGLEFGLGGSITLALSRKVNIDGKWMDMPDGFPAMDRLQDGVPVFVARFPRFTDTAFYNPLLTTSKEGLPTSAPSFEPSSIPTLSSSPSLSLSPTDEPTSKPTAMPSLTGEPTSKPTAVPTSAPSTLIPSSSPTSFPTNEPTPAPSTLIPSASPTIQPTPAPSTLVPSSSPTNQPTSAPSTLIPLSPPTDEPTSKPTVMPSSFLAPVDTSPTFEPISVDDGETPPGDGLSGNGSIPDGETPPGDETPGNGTGLDGEIPPGEEVSSNGTSPNGETIPGDESDGNSTGSDRETPPGEGLSETPPTDDTPGNSTGPDGEAGEGTHGTLPEESGEGLPGTGEGSSGTVPGGDSETPDGEETSGTFSDGETPPGEGSPGTLPDGETYPDEGLVDGGTTRGGIEISKYSGGYVVPTCGDLSSDSAVVLTAWNTFVDATETQGEEIIVDRHATLMRDAIEFPLFPERSADNNSPLVLYDIDFTRHSITFTLRNVPDARHQMFSDGTFDHYYFDLGAPVADASIDTELTTIKSTVKVLPQGYSTTVMDPLNLRIVMPVLTNGGILVSVLPGANLTELGQSIVVCYSREDRVALAFQDKDVLVADDKEDSDADGSVCGDQSSDSSTFITAWNTFEDASYTEGKDVMWDTFGSTMSDEIEFHIFPSSLSDNLSPWGFYDIDFTSSSITYTLRNISAANHLIFSEGSFDRYYFSFKGKKVTEATIVKDGTTVTSTIQILLPGFTKDDWVDQMGTGVDMPILVNGGLLVSIVPGAKISDLGQKIVICYSLEDGEEESSLDLRQESSSSPRFHSFISVGTIISASIIVGIMGCL